MAIKTVGIIGLGALGVIYADFFTKKIGKENTKIFADSARIKKYQQEGIYFNDKKCDFNYVDPQADKEPVDLLLFAVKYRGLPSAMESVRSQVGPNTTIISILNGIQSEFDLRSAFGDDQVIDCVAQKMAARKEGNRADCTNMGELAIGDTTGKNGQRLQELITFFDALQFPYEVPADIRRQLWEKLMCNVGANQTVMVFEGTYDTIQKEGKPREIMQNAMREVAAVANAEGIGLTEDDVQNWVNVLDHLTTDSSPSMRQDGKAHRPSEVELFAGTICRLGRDHKVPTPVNDWLYKRVKEIEATY